MNHKSARTVGPHEKNMNTGQRQRETERDREKGRACMEETKINKFLIFQFGYAEAKEQQQQRHPRQTDTMTTPECSGAPCALGLNYAFYLSNNI